MTSLVDFHCHLDLFPDPEAIIAQVEGARIRALTMTTTPRAWPHNRELTKDKTYIRPALGYHPELIKGDSSELQLWEKYLPEAKYIGEVGLDGRPEARRYLAEQKEVFSHILRSCAREGKRILSIHSTFAVTEALNLIEEHLPPARGKIVLHWFTGTSKEATRATDLGCYFSINSAMLSSTKNCAMLAELPTNRIITETDSPFILLNGKTQSPLNIKVTVKKLSTLIHREPEATAQIVHENLIALVS